MHSRGQFWVPGRWGRASGLAYSDSSSLVSFRLSRNVSSRRSSSPKGRRRRAVTWQMRTRARASYRPRERETARTGRQFAFKSRDVNSSVTGETQTLGTSSTRTQPMRTSQVNHSTASWMEYVQPLKILIKSKVVLSHQISKGHF